MTSSRLPGKVLMPILGRPMLVWELERLHRVRDDVRVVVATTVLDTDDAVVALCRDLGVPVTRGSEADVLDRYWRAAVEHEANPVIRITADCPLIDPDVTREVLQLWEQTGADYASNTLDRRYPRGLDTEVISQAALRDAWESATQPFEREHVTPVIYLHPERFRLAGLRNEADESTRRWTVDTAEDLEFVRAVYSHLVPTSPQFRSSDIRGLLERHPEIEAINRHVEQKDLRR
jgi:spore coat polysaccharide biosynthesis protein SpsF